VTRGRRIRLGLIDIDSRQWMAGAVYLRNLAYALASLPADERPQIELVGTSDPRSSLAEDIAAMGLGRVGGAPGTGGRVAAMLSGLGRRLQNIGLWPLAADETGRLDILYPAGFGLDMANTVRLFWIADFQHVHLPHLFPSSEIEARQRGIADIARQDAILILSSRSALADFRTLFPDAVVRPRIWSFCSSFGPAEAGGANPREAYGLPAKFLYVANQFWAHKDHLTVFKALAILKTKGITPPIVCTGLEEDFREPGHFRSLREYITREGLENAVRFLGRVPRRDQVQIFRLAAAVVQPSLFEGWSTVVEDAKALGRPLILSDIPPHREQATESDAFFRAGSPEHLARVVEDRWSGLKPGPDLEAEQAARAWADRRRLEVGRAFMAIVHEALDGRGVGSTG
jgi:glycosyltransferase involved in cell wall biosynthesis